MENLIEYLMYRPVEYLILIATVGLVVGSFLNVVIHRLPKILEYNWKTECYDYLGINKPKEHSTEEKISLLFPRSRCPMCKHKIAAWQNIPLISYLILKGQCFYCNSTISFRYPAVEFFTAALSVIVAWHLGVSFLTICGLLLTWCFIAQACIDMEKLMIPDEITMPFLWLGLIAAYFEKGFVSLESAFIGAVVGYLFLFTIYISFKIFTKKEGMGFGDFKLLAMIGAWLGWQMLPQVIFLGALSASIVGVYGLVVQGNSREKPMPFGPYLVCAAWIAMLWGEKINNIYFEYLVF